MNEKDMINRYLVKSIQEGSEKGKAVTSGDYNMEDNSLILSEF